MARVTLLVGSMGTLRVARDSDEMVSGVVEIGSSARLRFLCVVAM